ncbi:MAG: 4-hydroxythreonine-4-phosphate dehydrogenase PdxA [Planctomycetales bacterium]|nr:4-hydroxythreonine-4-phosphate dehydrogenase PdxA [Planctomycetales bacterium]
MNQPLPTIAVTMGDPAGIGPETIVAAWGYSAVHDICRPFVVGHPAIFRRALKLWNIDAEVVPITDPAEAEPSLVRIPCYHTGGDQALDVVPGKVSQAGGQAAYEAVIAAARLALAGQVDGITTAPLSKSALHAAGHKYPGHTELLAEACGVRNFAMMLHLPPGNRAEGPAGLSVVHVTLHMSLRDAIENITTEQIIAKTRLADVVVRALLKSLGIDQAPRIGVCALNPHAGEDGIFGCEERTIIRPAVEQAKRMGISAEGPLPSDTLMARAAHGEFDAVVAMYHDQGHIALKLLDMHQAVNVTLGLPIVRTSPDHGTAFDIAGKNQATETAMLNAIRLADEQACRREATYAGA